jgi:tRNA threonylcarbamoyladenosine biosynthesis protein TsaE
MPILAPNTIEFISRSPEQTRRFGMRLGAHLTCGDLVCLSGDLGSGKTTLVQGINSGWGSLDMVSSPTFVLVNVYRRPEDERLYHLDAYRLSGAQDAADLDLDAMLEQGAMVVEWAERIQEALPGEALFMKLTWIDEFQRDMLVVAKGERYVEILKLLRKEIFRS